MALDLSTLQANKAALAAKGFAVPTAPVEIAPQFIPGGAPAPVELSPQTFAAPPVEIAPQVIGAPQKFASGMSDRPMAAGVLAAEAAMEEKPGMFAAEPPPQAVAIFDEAKELAIAPQSPPTEIAPQIVPGGPPAPKPAAVGGGPVAVGGGGAPIAPKPITMADKEAAVLLPGQKEAFENEQEFQQSQGVWTDTIIDKELETRAGLVAREAEAVAAHEERLAAEHRERESFQAYYDGEHAKLNAESEKIANTKLDPHRLFTGEKAWVSVTAAVAASVFGVLGARATDGRNAGVDAVQAAINRDLELQSRDLENKKGEVSRKTGLLAQKFTAFGNMQQAKAAARIDAYQLAMRKADVYAKQQGTEKAALEAAKLKEGLSREIDRAKEQFGIGVEAGYQSLKAQQAKAAAAAAGATAADAKKYRDKIMEVELAGAKSVVESLGKEGKQAAVVMDGNHVVVVDPITKTRLWDGSSAGVGGNTVTIPGEMNAAGQWSSAGVAQAHGAEAATKFNEVADAAKKGKRIVEEIRKLREKYNGGAFLPSSEDKARAEFLQRELFKAGKTAGENSDKDAERIEKTIPDILSLDFKAPITGGKTYTDSLVDQWDARFDSDIDRAKSTYLKKPPANPLPLTAPPPSGK